MATQSTGPSSARAWTSFLTAATVTFCTFVLICSGALVTSHAAGMAVPDWPNTFGYNMFLFPIERWVGGIMYEHVHRLIASGIGLLTILLAVVLFCAESRGWVKKLGVIAVVAVILQGIMGGLRVTLIKNEIGIFHGMFAQSFFVLLGVITLATSPWFRSMRWSNDRWAAGSRWLAVAATVAILFQLGTAATMRHAHAGLSIPDFPTAYGKVWPDTDPATISRINEQRLAATQPPTSAALILLQMTHRLGAVLVLVLIGWFTWKMWTGAAIPRSLKAWSLVWSVMVLGQIGLGAWTIWSNKAADVATAHVALGALMLLLGGMLSFRLIFGHFAARRELLATENRPIMAAA